MKHIAVKSLVIGSSLIAASCSRPTPGSSLKEGLDRNSSFNLLGDIGSPTFETLLETKSVATPRLPWTDTYWPLTEKGLSKRWSDDTNALGIAAFFESQIVQDKAVSVDPLLSPADKYDILFRWRHSRTINEARSAEIIKGWADVEAGLDMAAEVSSNRSKFRDVFNQFRSKELADFRSQFPMSSDGWNSWLSYTSKDTFKFLDTEGSGEDWSWMGSCHGWAPAALMEQTPKHSVLAKFDDREVLLTEGDIRGLLTKSWADHSPTKEQYFVGRRCNTNSADPEGEIPHGAEGRGYYGQIKRGDANTPFYVKSELYTAFARSSDRIYPLTYDDDQGIDGYLLETYVGNNKRTYVLSTKLDALKAYVQNGSNAEIETLDSVEMFGCWDVNPATFHMALVQKIGKEGIGLVMDRTRTGQVWNQPVYSADFEIGELQPVSTVGFSRTRAPGTKFVASVTATVKWVSEPAEQRFAYTKAFDEYHSQDSVYTYVLEFDRSRRLIGGEWGTLDGIDPAQITPDFVFGFTPGSKPLDDIANGFDYTGIVAQIHECSLLEATDGKVTVNDQELNYTTCNLTKAP